MSRNPQSLLRGVRKEKTKMQQKEKGVSRKEPGQSRGPRADFARVREYHRSKHKVVCTKKCDVCYDCGRTTSHDLQPMLQTNVWRQPCVPRALYDKVLKQGHDPVLVQRPKFRLDGWACRRCHWSSNNLISRRCHADTKVPAEVTPTGSNGQVANPRDSAPIVPNGNRVVPKILAALLRGASR